MRDALAVEVDVGLGRDAGDLEGLRADAEAFCLVRLALPAAAGARRDAARDCSRLPAMRKRSALSLMNPSASAWS